MSFASSAFGASLRLALVGALLTFAVNTQARAQEQPAGAPAVAEATGTPTVAAAASLRYALDEIAKRFEKETGKSVKITYGATGSLVHQIEAGAPFQALFAADDASVKKLAKAGKTEGDACRLRAGRTERRRAEGLAGRHRRRPQGAQGGARRRQGEACRHRQSGDGALWPRRAGNVDEGGAVGAGAAAARHRREHRTGGDVRLHRRRRGRLHRQVARHLQGDRAEDQLGRRARRLARSRSITAWRSSRTLRPTPRRSPTSCAARRGARCSRRAVSPCRRPDIKARDGLDRL